MKNIWTIVKKELRGYFNNPTAYIVMVIFLALWEFLFFRSIFLIGEASVRELFSTLPLFLLLIIPAITMGSIAQERSEGTLEFLLTRPIKELHLIIGKFLAALFFATLTLGFSLPIAWSLSKFGNLDWGMVISQYLAGVLMASVLISLGIFVSGLFKSQISALLTTAAVSFFLIIAGSDLITSRLPMFLAPFFEQLGISVHFSLMSRGVIDFRDVWYFISMSAIFLILAYLQFLKRKFGVNKRIYRNYQLATVLFIGIAVFSNIIGYHLPGRLDLTEGKVYTFSEVTKKTVEDLNDVLNITFFASKELPAQLRPVLREIEDVLRDYKTLGKGNIIVERKDPSKDEKIAREAASMGIQEQGFNIISNEEFQLKKAYLGVAVSFGDEHESIPFVGSTEGLEYQLTGFIKKLSTEDKSKVAFLSGHGERDLNYEFKILNEELGNQFEVIPLVDADSSAESQENQEEKIGAQFEKKLSISDDVKVLVIAGPKKKVSDDSRKEIERYLNAGGSALVLIDGIEVQQRMMTATANKDNFSDFLKEKYGVEIKSDMVYDLRSNETISFSGGMMNFLTPYPFWLRSVRYDDSNPITSKIETVMFPWSSSISYSEKSGVETSKVLTTTKFAGVQTGQFSISPEQKFSQSNLKARTLAVTVKAEKEGSENRARLVVVGDSDFLTDQYIQNQPSNLAFGIESVSWLAQEDSLTEIQMKNSVDRRMMFENESKISFIKYGNLALAIVLPASYGALRLAKRKKKSRRSFNN